MGTLPFPETLLFHALSICEGATLCPTTRRGVNKGNSWRVQRPETTRGEQRRSGGNSDNRISSRRAHCGSDIVIHCVFVVKARAWFNDSECRV